MLKAFDYKCTNKKCGLYGKVEEHFIEGSGTPVCICEELMEKVFTAHAGYSIKGDNGASRTPKQSGSFRRIK